MLKIEGGFSPETRAVLADPAAMLPHFKYLLERLIEIEKNGGSLLDAEAVSFNGGPKLHPIETLYCGLRYAVEQYAQLLGMAKEDARYLEIGDIPWHILAPLYTNLPPEYGELAMNRIFLRARLLFHIVGHNGLKTGTKTPKHHTSVAERVSKGLAAMTHIQQRHSRNDLDQGDPSHFFFQGQQNLHETVLDQKITSDTFQASAQNPRPFPDVKTYYINCDLNLKKEALRGKFFWKQTFICQSKLSISSNEIDGGRVVRCNGRLQAVDWKEGHLVVNAETGKLSVTGSRFLKSKIEIKSKNTKFLGTTFDDCALKIDSNLVSGEEEKSKPVFDTCDFSATRLDDDQLILIAKLSRNCVFNTEQRGKLARSGNTNNLPRYYSPLEMVQKLSKVPGLSGLQCGNWQIPGSAKSDFTDPERVHGCHLGFGRGVIPGDIEETPFLACGVIGDSNGPTSNFDFRNWVHPLDSKEITNLPQRIMVFQKIAAFVKDKSKPPTHREWRDFFETEVGIANCSHIGIGGEYFKFPKKLFSSMPKSFGPYKDCNNMDYRIDYSTQADYNWQYRKKTKRIDHGEIPLAVSDSAFQYVADVGTTAAIVQQQLENFYQRLYELGNYINKLLGHGLHWPEYADDYGPRITINGTYHPNLLHQVGHGQIVTNDAELQPGQMVAISGLNSYGKTDFQTALALTEVQAQCGLPVPGTVKLGPALAYDRILKLPNRRSKAGASKSVSQERYRDTIIKFHADLSQYIDKNSGAKVLIAVDEMGMGSTSATSDRRSQANFIADLIDLNGKNGAGITILFISPEAVVVEALSKFTADETNHRGLRLDSLRSLPNHKYRFLPGEPVDSTPADIAADPAEQIIINRLFEQRGWHPEEFKKTYS